MNVYICEGEHYHVPGRRVTVHATKAGAEARALELAQLICADHNETHPESPIEPPTDASPETLEYCTQQLQEFHGAQYVYVTVDEYEVAP